MGVVAWAVGVSAGVPVGWSTGVGGICGWLLVVLPLPPLGVGKVGCKSTVPCTVFVGAVCGMVEYCPTSDICPIILLVKMANTMLAIMTRAIAPINTWYAGSLRHAFLSLLMGGGATGGVCK